MTNLEILERMADGDHINVYGSNDCRLATSGEIVAPGQIRVLRSAEYVAETRPGNLEITKAGRVLVEFCRLDSQEAQLH